MKKGSGVLLHISSLPSSYGVGMIGKEAREFIDYLSNSGDKYWQILPLTPIGVSNSPYQSYSAFASNYLFIDIEELCKMGLLSVNELESCRLPILGRVDFRKVKKARNTLLRKAFRRFDRNSSDFREFSADKDYIEYACFMTLKEVNGGIAWYEWSEEFRRYGKSTLKKVRDSYAEMVDYYLFLEYIFDRQWKKLKEYANARDVKIIGDMPIYLDYDSVEAWSHSELLQLDKDMRPSAVAGVPPDYFSADGQLWGNPLYDWEYHRKTSFAWWKKRLKRMLDRCDFVRIDHFRGFYEYYAIPREAETAREGEWRAGAGEELFASLSAKVKERIIAEDLGCLNEGTVDFFRRMNFPGMKVLQFAFDGNDSNPHLPKNYPNNCIVYTGTHDNDTLKGWLCKHENKRLIKSKIRLIAKALGIDAMANNHELKSVANVESKNACHGDDCEGKKVSGIDKLVDLLIEIAKRSAANVAIIPMQDYEKATTKSRMNIPGTVSANNWTYRLKAIPQPRNKS